MAILIVTHAVNMLTRLAERAIVFGGGRVEFDGDLPRGIAAYERLVDVKQQSNGAPTDGGSSEARIGDCASVDATGAPLGEMRTGDPLRLRITIDSGCEIASARLVVTLGAPDAGVIAALASHEAGLELDLAPGSTTVEVLVPDLPLTVGAYYATVTLFGPGQADFYHRRIGAARFAVVGRADDGPDRVGAGIIRLPHRWTRLD
jgi:lipopolysaccharide transport system ATP-binding protein